jgi:hypothetical protein
VVQLGYPRGVQRVLKDIEAAHPECADWLAPLRALALDFGYDRMNPLIDAALQGPAPEAPR